MGEYENRMNYAEPIPAEDLDLHHVRNLVGIRFSRLVVQERAGVDDKHNAIWKCRCDCGNIVMANSRQLRKRDKRDCGCMQGIRDDITGQQYGMLTALVPEGKSANGFTMWRCRCQCGNEIVVEARRLKNGMVSQCGCLPQKGRHKDITGMRFGKLVAIEKTGCKNKSGNSIWRCRCDCGNVVELANSQLVSGNNKSCGCLKKGRPSRKEMNRIPQGRPTVL